MNKETTVARNTCPYCDKYHRNQETRERCQDRYEENYDELEALFADDPRDDPEVQKTWLQIMMGNINDLDVPEKH